MTLWIWDCEKPGCEGGSKKPLTRTRAKRGAKVHNDKYHESKDFNPTFTKLKDIKKFTPTYHHKIKRQQ